MTSSPKTPASSHSPIQLVIASLLLVPAATYGFIRIFADQSTIIPLIAAATISGGLSFLLRLARFSLLSSLAASLVGLFLLLELKFAAGTQQFGLLPSRDTFDILRSLYETGLSDFKTKKAPVVTVDSFVAASMSVTWLMAFLTDWGALRLRLAFEPVLPAGLLFFFASVLGSGQFVLRTTIVFAAAVMIWAVVQRSTNMAARNVWLATDARRGPIGIAASATAVALAALVIGVIASPHIPGANSEELYYWRDKADPTRSVVSPYVSIRDQLVRQSDTLMFTVVADQPAYWRLVGLDSFDVNQARWTLDATFKSKAGDLPGYRTGASVQTINRQDFTIEGLGAIWLPAAFSPTRIIESTAPARWHADTSSLTISDDFDTSDGIHYIIESVVADVQPAELAAASSFVPSDIADQYLELPDSLSPVVADQAEAITRGAKTRYEQMLALQSFFRTFDYSVELGERRGDAVEQFLDERVGFCQHFSGTFALMARSLGAPARVAIGFTWGEPTENSNEYAVTGRNAHAWPEVYFDGLGWVAFEPTPGRGAPDAGYTNVPQAQDSDQPFQGLPSTTVPQANTPQSIDSPNIEELDDPTVAAQSSTDEGAQDFPLRASILLGALLAYAIGVPAIRRQRRIGQRRSAVSAAARIDLAWKQAMPALDLGYGLRRSASETRTEFAARATKIRQVPGASVNSLADDATIARFAPSSSLDGLADSAVEASAEIRNVVRSQTPWWRRWLRELDPRTFRQG